MQAIAAIELSAGNYDAVRLAVQPSYDHDSVTFGNWALPQLIEAATRLGDRDAAAAALERLSVRASLPEDRGDSVFLPARERSSPTTTTPSRTTATRSRSSSAPRCDLTLLVPTFCTASGCAARSAESMPAKSSGRPRHVRRDGRRGVRRAGALELAATGEHAPTLVT